VFWDVIDTNISEELLTPSSDLEYGNSKFLQNVGTHLPNVMA
jgi:hypothetical protein